MDERPAASGYFWSFWFTVRKRNWRVLVSAECSLLRATGATGQHVQSSFTSFLSLAQCSSFDELIRLLYTPLWIFVSLSCLTSTTHLFGFLRKTAQSTICPNSWCELNSKTSELCFGSFLLGYVAQPSRSSFQSLAPFPATMDAASS